MKRLKNAFNAFDHNLKAHLNQLPHFVTARTIRIPVENKIKT